MVDNHRLALYTFTIFLFQWSWEEFTSQNPKTEPSKSENFSNISQKKVQRFQTFIEISYSNAMQRIKAIKPASNSKPELYETLHGDKFWKFKHEKLAVDFWQPVIAQYSKGISVTNFDFQVYTNLNIKDDIDGRYGEYVGSLAWWFAWQRQHGNIAYRKLPKSGLLDAVNKSCGGCGEETGFRLMASRSGFKINVQSTTLENFDNKHIPAVITWTSGGLKHAGVIIENNSGTRNFYKIVQFMRNFPPIIVHRKIPENAKAWKITVNY